MNCFDQALNIHLPIASECDFKGKLQNGYYPKDIFHN